MTDKTDCPNGSHGRLREQQILEIAAQLGVSDFVYVTPPARKGAALREIGGDGLLMVGAKGAILQVKAREPQKIHSDSPERAKAWVKKHAKKASKQGSGTRREIHRRVLEGDSLKLMPLRALGLSAVEQAHYQINFTGDVTTWPTIIILDHPAAVGEDLAVAPNTVVFSADDWLTLFTGTRSVSAILRYVERVIQDDLHTRLGHEAARYSLLRQADIDWAESSNSATAVPYLPDLSESDQLGAELYRDILEKVWPRDGHVPWGTASEYRRIVEFMDNVQPTIQALVGRWILRKREELASGQPIASGLVQINKSDRIVFLCTSLTSPSHHENWFREVCALTELRHRQAIQTGAPEQSITLGIGVLVDDTEAKRGVSYTFCLLTGSDALGALPRELAEQLEDRYGIHDHRAGTTKTK